MMDTNADTDITNLNCEAMSVESTEITITDTSEHVNPDPLWEVLPNTPLVKLLDDTSKEASVNISMLLLPVLTIVSGLMGISTVSTHRDEINFTEPNIIWSAVAAPPGSRKTVALKCLLAALKRVKDTVCNEQAETSFSGLSTQDNEPCLSRLFCSNETITMAKLHEQLSTNNGTYLNILDEIEGLFECLENKGRPDSLDRRVWLTLSGGGSWARNSKQGLQEIEETRLNYTGFLQPRLLNQRMKRGDIDGFLDRHLICFTTKRYVKFQEIGKRVESGKDLFNLFLKVFQNHHCSEKNFYKLNSEAGTLFEHYFDEMEAKTSDLSAADPSLGLVNKSSGYVLRLAMVLEAASNALEEGVPVNRSVQASSMTQAIAVMRHLDGWKLNIIAMPQRRGEQAKENRNYYGAMTEEQFLELNATKRLHALKEKVITARTLQQNKIIKTASECKDFLMAAEKIGLGTITQGARKNSMYFSKK